MSTEPVREKVSGVLGVGFGLALIAACALALAWSSLRRIDAGELLAADFELGEWPLGFAVEECLALPTGEKVVVLGRGAGGDAPAGELSGAAPAGVPDAAPAAPAERPQQSAGEDGPVERFDWSAIPEGEKGTPPAKLYLVRYPPAAREGVLARQFGRIEWKDAGELEREGGRIPRGGGTIRWGEYDPSFVLERRYHAGTFRDSVRVNLSLPRTCWVAYAVWPERLPGSQQPVERLLAALRPQ